jgi:hypothetical protein
VNIRPVAAEAGEGIGNAPVQGSNIFYVTILLSSHPTMRREIGRLDVDRAVALAQFNRCRVAIMWRSQHANGVTFPDMSKRIEQLIRRRAELAAQWRDNHADRTAIEIELDRASTLLAELTDLGLPLRTLRSEIPTLLAGDLTAGRRQRKRIT